MASNVIKYLSNVGKSVVYSTVDQFKEMNPAIISFKETNADTLKYTYDILTHLKKSVKKTATVSLESEYSKIAIAAKNNLFEDIVTGQFYNRERKDKADTEAATKYMQLDDFDEDFVIDQSSFSLDDDVSTNDMIDIVGEKSSNAISTAVARSSEYIVTANTEINKAMYEQNKVIFAGMSSHMKTINDNIGSLMEYANGPLNTHIENSIKYFETSNKLDEERNSMLKEILEIQKEHYKPYNTYYHRNSKRLRVSDITDSEGMVNIADYVERIKQNLSEMSSGSGFDMISYLIESGAGGSFVSSPLKFVSDKIASTLIPNVLKKSMKSFNDSLSGVFASAIAKLNNSDSSSGIISKLQDIFGIDDSVKRYIDSGQYEKGATPFDGITRKAIIEVIPTYLAQIASAVTGKKENRFNYQTGKFINVDKIKEEMDDIENSASSRASMDLQYYFTDFKRQLKFDNEQQQEQFNKDLKQILDYSYRRGMLFNSKDNRSAESYGLTGGKLSDVNLDIIKAFFDSLPNGVKLQYASNMFQARDYQNDQMYQIEKSGDSVLTALNNNSIQIENALKSVNEKTENATAPGKGKNSVLCILSDIYDEVHSIRVNGVSGRGRRRRGPNKPKGPDSGSGGKKDEDSFYQWADNDAASYSSLTSDNAYKTILTGINKHDYGVELTDAEREGKTLTDKILDAEFLSTKTKIIYQNLDEIVNKPGELLAGIIDKANRSLYNVIFGDESVKNKREADFIEKGFIGTMLDTFKEKIDIFATWFETSVMVPVSKFINRELFQKKYEEIVNLIGFDPKDLLKKAKMNWFGGTDEWGNEKEGKFGDFFSRFGNEFKDYAKTYKDTMSDVADSLKLNKKLNEEGKQKKSDNKSIDKFLRNMDKLKDDDDDNGVGGTEDIPNAAEGLRRVNKTGVIAVSEGEMIIPESLKPSDVKENLEKENAAKDKFKKYFNYNSDIEGYAEGGRASFKEYVLKAVKDKDEDKLKIINEKLKKIKKTDPELFEEIYSFIENDRKEINKDDYVEGRDKSIFGKSVDYAKNLGKSIKDYYHDELFPDKKEQKKEKEKLLSTGYDELKKYAPEVGAGAVIGTGISLITGAIGGPLIGAAVSGGISLLKNSTRVQKILFGEDIVDEEGNKSKSGGILSKELSTNLNKYAPAVGKGALAGAITSILPFVPGGPVAGVILGSAIGFASQNETVKNKLFGEDTTLGKLTEKLKKRLPAMGAGAVAGLVAGPFGVVSNILLGSAIGYATTTDKFKNLMFGYTDEHGEVHEGVLKSAADNLFTPLHDFFIDIKDDMKEWAKTDILGPLKKASDPLKKQLELTGKKIEDFFKNSLNKIFEDNLGVPLNKFLKDKLFTPMSNFIKGFIKGALSPIKFIASSPFKAIGAIGDHYKKKQIQSGDADYTTAAERMEFREKKGNGFFGRKWKDGDAGRFTDYDKAIVNAGDDKEKLNRVLKNLQGIQEEDEKYNNFLNPAYDDFNKNIRQNTDLSYKQTRRITKQIKKMVEDERNPDYAAWAVNRHINAFDFNSATKEQLRQSANAYIANYKVWKDKEQPREEAKSRLLDQISKDFGVKNINQADIPKLIEYLKKEIPEDVQKAINPDESDKAPEQKAPVNDETFKTAHDETIETLSNIESIAKTLVEGVNNIYNYETKKFRGPNDEDYDDIFDNFKDLSSAHNMGSVDKLYQQYEDRYDTDDYNEKVRKLLRTRVAEKSIATGTIAGRTVKASVKGLANLGVMAVKGLGTPVVAAEHVVERFGKNAAAMGVDELKNVKTKAVSKIFDPTRKKEQQPEEEDDIKNYAEGTDNVEEDGLAAVSEGETIVPKNMNPVTKAKKLLNKLAKKIGTIGKILDDDDDDDTEFGGITVDSDEKDNDKKKKIFYATTATGKLIKYYKDKEGKLSIDKTDNDTDKNIREMEEEDNQKKSLFSKLAALPGSLLDKFKKKKDDDDDDDDKDDKKSGSILSRIVDSTGTIGKAVGLTIGLPILVGFWNDTVWPVLKPILEPLGENIKSLGGTLWDKAKKWLAGEETNPDGSPSGLPGLIEKGIEYWGSGLEVLLTKVLPKTVEILIKCLPTILMNLGTAIVKGFKVSLDSIFNPFRSTDPDDYLDKWKSEEAGGVSASAMSIAQSSNNKGADIVLKATNNMNTWAVDEIDSSSGNLNIQKVQSDSTAGIVTGNNTTITSGSNVINYDNRATYSVPGVGNMTSEEIFKYDGVVGTDEYGNEVKGTELLDHPELLEQMGIDSRRLTDAEREENTKKLGLDNNVTAGKALASTTAKAFLRGNNRASGVIKFTGKALGILPGGKIAKHAANTVNKGLDIVANTGQTVLPNWVTENVEDVASKPDKGASIFSKIRNGVGNVADEMLGGDMVQLTNSAMGEKMSRAEAIAQGLSEEMGDFAPAAARSDSLLSKIGGKLDDVTNGKASNVLNRLSNNSTSNAAKEAAEETSKGLLGNIISRAKNGIKNFIKKLPLGEKLVSVSTEMGKLAAKETAEQATEELAEKIANKLAKVLGEELAKSSGKALAKASATIASAGVITTVTAVAAFVKGWNNTNSIIGVVDEVDTPSPITKFVCGIASALNEIFVMGLIPLDTVVDIVLECAKHIPFLSELVSGVIENKEESEEIVAKFNEKNGTNLTVAEYNKAVNANKGIKGTAAWQALFGKDASIDEDGNYHAAEDGLSDKAKKALFGKKAYTDEFGNYHEAEDGLTDNIAHFFGGNKETGEKNIFGKAGDWISDKFDTVSDGVHDIGDKLGDIWEWATNKTDKRVSDSFKDAEDNKVFGKISNVLVRSIEHLLTPVRMVNVVGKEVGDFLSPMFEYMSTSAKFIKTDSRDAVSDAWNGDIKRYFDIKHDGNGEDLNSIGTATKTVSRILSLPVALVATIAGGISRGVSTIIDGAKTVFTNVIDSESELICKGWNGEVTFGELFDCTVDGETGAIGGISTVLRGISRIFTIPITGVAALGGFIGRGISNIIDGTKTAVGDVIESEQDLISDSWNGDVKLGDFFSVKKETDQSGPLGWLTGFMRCNARIVTGPIAAIAFAGGSIFNLVEDVIDSAKDVGTYIDKENKRLEPYHDKDCDSLDGFWKNATKVTTDGPFKYITKAIGGILRVFNFVTVMPRFILNKLTGWVDDLTGWVTEKYDSIKKRFNKFFSDKTDELKENDYYYDDESGKGTNLKKFSGRGTRETNEAVKNGTFISQVDSKYSKKRFNITGDSEQQTIGDTGCAPASAAMVINSFKTVKDRKLNVLDTAKNAISYKTKDNGVTADYFGEEFRNQGLNTKYIMDENPNTRAQNIATSLYNNDKVVLMGQDFKNNSKDNSPFGPDAHYVVATGMSPDGKYIYINDPESDIANIPYPSGTVLGSTSIGISAGASKGSKIKNTKRHNRIFKAARASGLVLRNVLKKYNGSGSELPGSTTEEQCWNFLKSAGFSDASAAGVVGNMRAESGDNIDPTALQSGVGPAAGICQWETYNSYEADSRWGQLSKYAQSKGKPWTDLQCQLEFVITELEGCFSTYSGKSPYYFSNGEWCWWPEKLTVDQFKNINDVAEATEIFERVFERGRITRMNDRIAYAQDTYNKFSGKYTKVDGLLSSSGSSGSDTYNSILDTLNVFDKLAAAYGLTSSSSSSDSSSSSSSSSTAGAVGGNEKQKALVDKMKSVEGKLAYSQAQRNPDYGSGDCSSTVQWAYKNVLGADPGGWTGEQMDDPDTYTVANNVNDESKLQPGDLILYDGYSQANGHVEMYMGDGKMIGHGGGDSGSRPGPVVSNLMQDFGGKQCNRVRRWEGFKEGGSGSGLDTSSKFMNKRQVNRAKTANWVSNNINYSNKHNNSDRYILEQFDEKASSFSAMGSGTYSSPGVNKRADIINPESNSGIIVREVKTSDTSKDNNNNVLQSLFAIVQLLSKVVQNTDSLQNIVSILSEIISVMNEQSKSDNSQQQKQELQTKKENLLTSLRGSVSNKNDEQIINLVKQVESLARA